MKVKAKERKRDRDGFGGVEMVRGASEAITV